MHPMEVSAMDAILWELKNPVALFNWSVITYQGIPVPKGLPDFQHFFEL
jgi:hypothetical protein